MLGKTIRACANVLTGVALNSPCPRKVRVSVNVRVSVFFLDYALISLNYQIAKLKIYTVSDGRTDTQQK